MKKTPIIGLTLDAEEPAPGEEPVRYSKFPWYALRQNYAGCLSHCGAAPLALPHEPFLAETYLDLIDGLVVTGGAFDVDPALFGAETTHETVTLKNDRTDFELAILKGALERDMPILGICGGQQLLNVVLGGTLIQHVPDVFPDGLAHEQPNPRDEAGHEVAIEPNTQLEQVMGAGIHAVNSAHHQAVDRVGPGVVINAYAPDGVIEGIEAPSYRFCLGVQWHPEFFICPGDERLIAAFVEACRR